MNDDGDFDVLSQALSSAVKTVSDYMATACGLLRTAIDYQVTVLRNER